MRSFFRFVASVVFVVYVALFPGSTTTVALDAVPAWGLWMGAALLTIQGIAAISWLIAIYGKRGILAGVLAALLAWFVEHTGETTGVLFGRYHYTDVLQPQIVGVVPIAITCAWLMVALGSWQLANWLAHCIAQQPQSRPALRLFVTASLVVLLDLQIETIATMVNNYWIWVDSGPYYGVPTQNFIMWWFVGLAMAWILQRSLADAPEFASKPTNWRERAFWHIPALLYLLSSLMFTIVNFAHHHDLAAWIGTLSLAAFALLATQQLTVWKWLSAASSASAVNPAND
jgi:bisanhydrobacterioruberin hydratase